MSKDHTVLTYDVKTKHVEVKDALKKIGYHAGVTLNSVVYQLPSTTVWRQDGSPDQAITDIKNVCASLGVVLQNAVSVVATSWSAHKGS